MPTHQFLSQPLHLLFSPTSLSSRSAHTFHTLPSLLTAFLYTLTVDSDPALSELHTCDSMHISHFFGFVVNALPVDFALVPLVEVLSGFCHFGGFGLPIVEEVGTGLGTEQ